MKKNELISIELEEFESLETVVAPSCGFIVHKHICPPKHIYIPKCH